MREDSPAAYYRFLRDHPDSKYAAAAQERLEFAKLKREPTLAGFEAFRKKYPQTTLLDELQPIFEEQSFDSARAVGSARAYDAFAENFPTSSFTARARGNAAYLSSAGFSGDPSALAAFAAKHPESDFAREALRTAETLRARDGSRFSQVGLVVDVAPGTPDAKRLEDAFLERATRMYEGAHVKLARVPEIRAAAFPGAILRIEHREVQVESEMSEGELAQPGMRASTWVRLSSRDGAEPFWQREFSLHVNDRDHIKSSSVLFGSEGPAYWDQFFVPIASWSTAAAARAPVALGKRVASVDAAGDRAVVLFQDGELQLLQIADPSDPVRLARFEPASGFQRWAGVRVVGSRIVLYGDEGLEIMDLSGAAAERVVSRPNGEIGAVFAAAVHGDDLLVASAKGLVWLPAGDGEPKRVMRRQIRGVDVSGELVVVADADAVFVSTIELLNQNRVLGQLRVGRDFETHRVRAFGKRAFVMGADGVRVLDLSNPRQPKETTMIRSDRVGRVEDAALLGGRIFLLGERGIQVLAPSLDRVNEIVDVAPDHRLAVLGRHLVAVGGEDMQVIDATPFGRGVPAKRAAPAAAKARKATRRATPPAAAAAAVPDDSVSEAGDAWIRRD